MSKVYDKSHATAIPPVVGASIDAAILTFVRTIMESETQPHPSQELALNAFATAFQRWNPQTINDIKPTDQDIFDLLFTNLSRPTPSSNSSTQNSLGMNAAPRYDHVLEGTMQDYRYKIGTIVQAFNQSLANGTLTIEELLAVCIALESSTWGRYSSYTNPLQSVAASTATPMLSSGTPSTGLFNAPPAFTFAVGSHTTASVGTHVIPYEVTSCQDGRASVNLQSISAMNACKDHSHEELRFADYSQGNRGSTPWPTRPVRSTGVGLGSTAPTPAFGAPFNRPTSFGGQPMTPFGTVDNGAVARLTCARQNTLRSSPNMQPHPLPLLPSINAILYEIDKLEDDSDSTVGVHYLTLLHTIYTLEHAWPVDGLEPLKYILHNSELREYFRDMQWLTIDDEYNADKGLQKFHKDYKTVVSILLSYDAMDDLMIVESLEPVVRLFFYLERHYNSPRVQELVLGLKNDQDIQTLLQGTTTLQDDIYDLSARIHSVRDLFQKVCHPPAPPTVHLTSILQAAEGTVPAPDLVLSNSDSTN